MAEKRFTLMRFASGNHHPHIIVLFIIQNFGDSEVKRRVCIIVSSCAIKKPLGVHMHEHSAYSLFAPLKWLGVAPSFTCKIFRALEATRHM